jgi:hypothetical protein
MADFSLPDWLSLEVRDLISSMLKKNPLERIKLRNSHCLNNDDIYSIA